MAFNKHKNMLKGISNVVEATSKEEQIHGDFGIDLIKILDILGIEEIISRLSYNVDRS